MRKMILLLLDRHEGPAVPQLGCDGAIHTGCFGRGNGLGSFDQSGFLKEVC